MNAICGSCGKTHPTIADYRACAAATPAKPLSEIGARMVRSAGIPLAEIEESRERWRNAPALPDVPAGRYALRTDGVVKFYILDRPESGRWAGYVFLKAQASDEKYPIKNPTAKAEILGRISEDIAGAQTLYGQELGRCYRCGRTLTDETSRELGIGPDCRSK